MRPTNLRRAEAQSFDRVAEDYDRLGDLNRKDLISPWLEGLLPTAGGRALDLGCGSGRHAVLLAERFEQVDAIDLSGPMIELARQRRPRPNIAYWQADLHDVEGAGHYDFVLSVLTLHHVPDLHAALSHIKTVLAPGGRARWFGTHRALGHDVDDVRPEVQRLCQGMLQWRRGFVREGLRVRRHRCRARPCRRGSRVHSLAMTRRPRLRRGGG